MTYIKVAWNTSKQKAKAMTREDKIRAKARAIWGEDDIEIDDNAAIACAEDNGIWVQAWLWIPWDERSHSPALSTDIPACFKEPIETIRARGLDPADDLNWSDVRGACVALVRGLRDVSAAERERVLEELFEKGAEK